MNHDVFWPLRGAHASADCFSCHEGERYGGTPRAFFDCHEDDYLAAADPPHASLGMSQRCESCHGEVAWADVKATWHDPLFPITRGDHAGFGCADCHPAGSVPPASFSCVGCHTERETDLRVTLAYQVGVGPTTDTHPSLDLALPLGKRVELALGYGFTTFRAQHLDERQDEHRLDAGLDLVAGRPWRLHLRGTWAFGTLPSQVGVATQLVWRFR